jgi:hypothetical protein
MLGVILLWQSTHCAAVAVCAGRKADERKIRVRLARIRETKEDKDVMYSSANAGNYIWPMRRLAVTAVTAGC